MRIVSWNIQWGRGSDGFVNLFRTISVLKVMNADVVCLQEVAVNVPGLPGGPAQDGLALLQNGLPEYGAVFAPAVDVAGEGSQRAQFGNLILSRYPVGQVWRHLLPWPADPRAPAMQRSCAEAIIEAPGGPLRVLSTHLEYYSALARLAQGERLRALQEEAAALDATPPQGRKDNPTFAQRPRPARAVLCGDFNCEPGSDTWKTLQAGEPAHAWRDAWQIAHATEPHAPSVGLHGAEWPDHPFCCDFIFVAAGLAPKVRKVWVDADTDASDHQPVVLELFD